MVPVERQPHSSLRSNPRAHNGHRVIPADKEQEGRLDLVSWLAEVLAKAALRLLALLPQHLPRPPQQTAASPLSAGREEARPLALPLHQPLPLHQHRGVDLAAGFLSSVARGVPRAGQPPLCLALLQGPGQGQGWEQEQAGFPSCRGARTPRLHLRLLPAPPPELVPPPAACCLGSDPAALGLHLPLPRPLLASAPADCPSPAAWRLWVTCRCSHRA